MTQRAPGTLVWSPKTASLAPAEAPHRGFLASEQRCLDRVVAQISRQVPQLLRLLGVALHPPRELRAPLLSGWACPTPASPARSSQRPTIAHPVSAPRSQEGFPCPPHHASIIVLKDSGFWSTGSVDLSLLTSITILLPPCAHSTKTNLSFQVSTVPVPNSPRGCSFALLNSTPLAPGAYAHAAPSL